MVMNSFNFYRFMERKFNSDGQQFH